MRGSHHITATEAAGRSWDAIIVGAGMGGCAAAFSLSHYPLDILIVERGHDDTVDDIDLTVPESDPDERMKAGLWPTRLTAAVNGRESGFWPPLGCGVGGSTQLYAAALDRFRPSDFAPRRLPDGREIGWPFGYDEIAPWYDLAETQLEVRGTAGALEPAPARPLPPPPEMSARDRWFFERFERAGLHPYRLHCGIRYKDGCESCLGRVCSRDCKRHAANSFLDPALASGRVRLCHATEVLRVEAGAERAEGVTVRGTEGQEITIAAGTVVVAAGAYFTPVLLLNSANAHWPQGLANRTDQVGRNLMFHSDRRLALWSRRGLSAEGFQKSIALRDFYEDETGEKYGELQSTGMEARYGYVFYALCQMHDMSIFARFPVLRPFLRIPAFLADRLLGGATIFVLITEDYPYPGNRVLADPGKPSGMRFEYVLPGELIRRTRRAEAWLNRALKGLRRIWLSRSVELNYGHPCGTCRMGDDPQSSVVDGEGRAHDVEGLYIACGSSFATSGGTNPSLTIAAIGLRLGDRLARRLTRRRAETA